MIFYELWEKFSKYKELKLKKESYRKISNNFKNHIDHRNCCSHCQLR